MIGGGWDLVGAEVGNGWVVGACACVGDFRLILRVSEGPGGFWAGHQQGLNSEQDCAGCFSRTDWEEVAAGPVTWPCQ